MAPLSGREHRPSVRSLSWSKTSWRAGFFLFQVIFPEPSCRLIDFREVILPTARELAVKAKPRSTQECVVHSSSRFVSSPPRQDLELVFRYWCAHWNRSLAFCSTCGGLEPITPEGTSPPWRVLRAVLGSPLDDPRRGRRVTSSAGLRVIRLRLLGLYLLLLLACGLRLNGCLCRKLHPCLRHFQKGDSRL